MKDLFETYEVNGISYTDNIGDRLIAIPKKQFIEYQQLQERIDRAIEYIEKHSNSFSVLDTISNAELLKILKGSDKE